MAFPPTRSRETSPPRHRLAFALCASLAAHAVLFAGPAAVPKARSGAAASISVHIEAAIQPGSGPEARIGAASASAPEGAVVHPSTPTARPEPFDSASVRAERREQPESKHERRLRSGQAESKDERSALRANEVDAPRTVSRPEKTASAIVTAPPAADPTWYSARDLDVYPRPAAPIRLDFLDAAGTPREGTRVTVQLLIDEHGTVREVTVVEALLQGELEEKTRSALAAARFLPAMKDERAVRSRVLLRLE